jgi:hypothetical protein
VFGAGLGVRQVTRPVFGAGLTEGQRVTWLVEGGVIARSRGRYATGEGATALVEVVVVGGPDAGGRILFRTKGALAALPRRSRFLLEATFVHGADYFLTVKRPRAVESAEVVR